MSENEIAVIEKTDFVVMAREPEVVLSEAKHAAKALTDVISNKKKPVMFNGEQYLEYEDWQTLGRFYSLAAKTSDSIPVEIEGIKGAKAQASIIDVRTGAVLGHAEAYCLRDEKNWSTKPWFQLASMAQTRAGAKAFRNVLSWVVVLAGYKTTPAEEMDSERIPSRPPIVPQLKEAKSMSPASTTDEGALAEIKARLAEMNEGKEEIMDTHLKALTGKDNKKFEIGLDRIDWIYQNNPKWFAVIRAKVSKAYQEYREELI